MGKLSNVEEFKENFIQTIMMPLDSDQLINELKERYWLPGKEWLVDALPWAELKEAKLKPIKVHMLSDSMGLLVATFELVPEAVLTFSLLKRNDRWYVDWQNREVWLLATENWESKSEGNLEVRFFETIEVDNLDFVLDVLQRINQWIQKKLGANEEKLVIVFGYDSFEYSISDTGHKPSGKGGNSRGKLILLTENLVDFRNENFESTYIKSILLHEMIHEYSCYDKQWKDSIDNMSLEISLLSEGVAMYYEFEYLVEELKSLDFDSNNKIVQKDTLGIIEALKYREQVLDLLSNETFTEVNRKDPKAGNPSYFLGASLYNYFLQKYGFEKTRTIYSEAGNKETEKAKSFLAEYFDKEEFLISSQNYLDSIRAQLNKN